MSKSGSAFHRAGTFDLSASSPVVLESLLQRLCFEHGYNTVETTLQGIAVRFLGDGDWQPPQPPEPVERETPPPEPEASEASGPEPAPEPRRNRRGKIITDTRSRGANAAWDTRRLIRDYMDLHPGVSRDEAYAIVKATQPERTRVAAEPRIRRGHKAWDTRVERRMQAALERGEPITREEAWDWVSKNFRGKREEESEQPPAAAPENDERVELAPEQPEAEQLPGGEQVVAEAETADVVEVAEPDTAAPETAEADQSGSDDQRDGSDQQQAA